MFVYPFPLLMRTLLNSNSDSTGMVETEVRVAKKATESERRERKRIIFWSAFVWFTVGAGWLAGVRGQMWLSDKSHVPGGWDMVAWGQCKDICTK